MRHRLFRRLSRSISFVIGASLLSIIVVIALLAPLLTAHDPFRSQIMLRLLPPAFTTAPTVNPDYPLGTDQVGRDIMTRLMFGARWSLFIAFTASLSAAALGVILGTVSGYFGGATERVMMGFADVQLSIPAILLAIAVVAVLGPNIRNLILVLILTGWVIYARTVRAQVIVLRHREFIQAAEALGASRLRILANHLLPNVLTPVIVIFSQQLGFMILMETALSFLGLGVQPPTPSWGGMINEARLYLPIAPWSVILPGLALMITVLAVNLLGDGLRDALDPKLKI